MKRITDTTAIIGLITDLVMGYLEEFKDSENDSLYYYINPEYKGLEFTYTKNPHLTDDQVQEPISEQEAEELIKNKITEILRDAEIILLATDLDNGLVYVASIQKAGKYDRDEIQDIKDACDEVTCIGGYELPEENRLYILND